MDDVLQESKSVSVLLRAAKMIAVKLKIEGDANWISLELNGYTDQKELPDYRLIPARQLEVLNPMRGWIPAGHLGFPMPIFQPIPQIEELAKSETVSFPLTRAQNVEITSTGGLNISDWQQRISISVIQLKGILSAVRARLVDWSAKLDASVQQFSEGGKKVTAKPDSLVPSGDESEVDIFISHSSLDVELAEQLIMLLEKALGVSPSAIRCTSVPGYKLEIGADTDEAIRREVHTSKVFIGLLTPVSLQSSYVLFELGARWGLGLFTAPLLANGASGKFLKGPISGASALKADVDADLHQFLSDIGKRLNVRPRGSAVYTAQLKKVVELARVRRVVSESNVSHESQGPAKRRGMGVCSKDNPHFETLLRYLNGTLEGALGDELKGVLSSIKIVELRSLLDEAHEKDILVREPVDTRRGEYRYRLTPFGRELASEIEASA